MKRWQKFRVQFLTQTPQTLPNVLKHAEGKAEGQRGAKYNDVLRIRAVNEGIGGQTVHHFARIPRDTAIAKV